MKIFDKLKKIMNSELKFVPKEERIRNAILRDTYKTYGGLTNDFRRLANEAYKCNEITYAGVMKIARAISNLEFEAVENIKGECEVVEHPVLQLIKSPNKWQGQQEYLTEMIIYFLLSGMKFEQTVKKGKTPNELYNLRPDRMNLVMNKSKEMSFFYYDYYGEEFFFLDDEISYTRFIDPLMI